MSNSALLVLLFSTACLSAHAIDINATLIGLHGQGTLTLDTGTFTTADLACGLLVTGEGSSITIQGAGVGMTIIDCGKNDRFVTVKGGAKLTLKDLTITGGYVPDVGGCVLLDDLDDNGQQKMTSLYLTGTKFHDCYASVAGGAVGVQSSNLNAHLEITGENKISKSASPLGGGIAFYHGRHKKGSSGSLLLDGNLLFIDNGDPGMTHGGALWLGRFGGSWDAATAIIQGNVSFVQNKGKFGGAISVYGAHVSVTGASFTGNSATIEGGAIYISKDNYGGHVTLNGPNKFQGNSCVEPGCCGGALFLTHWSFLETRGGTQFFENMATRGGAFCGGKFSTAKFLDGTVFEGNIATNGPGGAIYAMGASGYTNDVFLKNVTFTRNSAPTSTGGAAYFHGSDLSADNVTLEDNAAKIGGGGFHLFQMAFGLRTANLSNFQVNRNNVTVTAEIAESTAVTNAGGGGLLIDQSVVVVHNATFANNTAPQGAGISLAKESSFATNNGLIVTGMLWLKGAIKFVSNSAALFGGDIFISQDSPLIEFDGPHVSFDGTSSAGGVRNHIHLESPEAQLYFAGGASLNVSDLEGDTLTAGGAAGGVYCAVGRALPPKGSTVYGIGAGICDWKCSDGYGPDGDKLCKKCNVDQGCLGGYRAKDIATTMVYCDRGCEGSKVGDGICDAACMSPACAFDGGDCSSHIASLNVLASHGNLYSFPDPYVQPPPPAARGVSNQEEYLSRIVPLISGDEDRRRKAADLNVMDYDADQNGLVDSREMRRLIIGLIASPHGPSSYREATIHAMFLLMDFERNMDGQISTYEATHILSIEHEPTKRRFTAETLQAFASDLSALGPVASIQALADAIMSLLSFCSHPGSSPPPNIHVVETLVQLADADMDGLLTPQDALLIGIGKAHFASIDKNVNGVISAVDILSEGTFSLPVGGCKGLQTLYMHSGQISIKEHAGNEDRTCAFLIQPSVYRKASFDFPSQAPYGPYPPSRPPHPNATLSHFVAFYIQSDSSKGGPGLSGVCGPDVHRICEGTLVGKTFVVTAADCAAFFRRSSQSIIAVVQGEEGEGAEFSIESVHEHPSWGLDDNPINIAVVKLSDAPFLSPIEMYDGDDVAVVEIGEFKGSFSSAVSPCYLPLTQSSVDPGIYTAPDQWPASPFVAVDMKPLSEEQCRLAHRLASLPDPSLAFPSEALCAHSPSTCPAGMQMVHGGGLIASGLTKSSVPRLIGVLVSGSVCSEKDVPATYTQITAPVREWVLEQMGKTMRSGLELSIDVLGLAPGANITVWAGSDMASEPIWNATYSLECPKEDEEGEKPVAEWLGGGSAMVMRLDMPKCERGVAQASSCDATEVTVSWEFESTETDAEECEIGVSWRELVMDLKPQGKMKTGGLADDKESVWVCVRDWDDERRVKCGANRQEWVCFKYSEVHRIFTFLGLNRRVKLVSDHAAAWHAAQKHSSLNSLFDKVGREEEAKGYGELALAWWMQR